MIKNRLDVIFDPTEAFTLSKETALPDFSFKSAPLSPDQIPSTALFDSQIKKAILFRLAGNDVLFFMLDKVKDLPLLYELEPAEESELPVIESATGTVSRGMFKKIKKTDFFLYLNVWLQNAMAKGLKTKAGDSFTKEVREVCSAMIIDPDTFTQVSNNVKKVRNALQDYFGEHLRVQLIGSWDDPLALPEDVIVEFQPKTGITVDQMWSTLTSYYPNATPLSLMTEFSTVAVEGIKKMNNLDQWEEVDVIT